MAERETSDPRQDPSDTSSGDRPMTDAQRSELENLAGEEDKPDRKLSQQEAEQLIDQLRHRTEDQTG